MSITPDKPFQSTYFDHEKLRVYRSSIQFVTYCEALLKKIPKKMSVHDQLDRASTSIPLNIAEGNGRFAPRDRCRYLDLARSSALECAACLDVLLAKGCLQESDVMDGKKLLVATVSMLMGLISTFRKQGGG